MYDMIRIGSRCAPFEPPVHGAFRAVIGRCVSSVRESLDILLGDSLFYATGAIRSCGFVPAILCTQSVHSGAYAPWGLGGQKCQRMCEGTYNTVCNISRIPIRTTTKSREL